MSARFTRIVGAEAVGAIVGGRLTGAGLDLTLLDSTLSSSRTMAGASPPGSCGGPAPWEAQAFAMAVKLPRGRAPSESGAGAETVFGQPTVMNRRAFLLPIALVLAAPLAVEAQQPSKIHRIGYLSLATAEVDRGWVASFRRGLRELGYVEGQTIIIEQRHAAGRPERLAGLAAELVRLKVDIFVVYGGVRAVQAVKQATGTIPIVLAVSADPVGQGLVASLARPGGQVTGLSDFHGSLVPKRLELLKDLAPSASRIALLLNPANPGALLQAKDIRAAAPAVGVTVFSVEVRGSAPDDFDRAFAAIGKERPDALLLIPDATFVDRQRHIAELAVRHRLPAIGTLRQYAESGFLMSYGANFSDLWRRAARYVDKILKGANPGDIPIEQASTFELVINLKTAKALGLTIPPSLLLRADQVIDP